MYKLIVIADDFTGALDTGARFAKAGVETVITRAYRPSSSFVNPPQVLVIDIESRHLEPAAACEAVREIALKNDAEYYYKKTDSALRGNIGAELEGLLPENEALVFIPAFPAEGRTTENGVHYFNGERISRTVFGKDPFEPVTCDYIPDIIAKQSGIGVHVIGQNKLHTAKDIFDGKGILVFDAVNDGQMREVAKAVEVLGPPKFMAGCAGFAEYLPRMLSLKAKAKTSKRISTGLIILSGSINEITMRQVSFAAEAGFEVIELTPEEKLCENFSGSAAEKKLLDKIADAYNKGRKPVIQAACSYINVEETDKLAGKMGLTKDEARQKVAGNMGMLAKSMTLRLKNLTLAVFGGDTLMSVMDNIGGQGIVPYGEIVSGVILSEVVLESGFVNLITKSGGFGGEDVISRISDYIHEHANR